MYGAIFPGVDNEELYHKLMLLSLHGQSKECTGKDKAWCMGICIIGTYYKCNMTDIMAAVGLVQFAAYEASCKKERDYRAV